MAASVRCRIAARPMPTRSALTEKLSTEEEAELGLIVRAVQDLSEVLDLPKSSFSLVTSVVQRLVGTALSRAKPNRRMAFLDQWRQFMCWLPEALKATPPDQRVFVADTAIQAFTLTDWRGKRKAPDIVHGANAIAMKDNEPWYVQVPVQAVEMPRLPSGPLPEDEWQHFKASHPVHQADAPASSIDLTQAMWLRPFNRPRVLRKEYERLHQRLKLLENQRRGLQDERIWKTEFPDVAETMVRRWFVGRDPTPSDLALLVAAYRVGLAPSYGSLSRLRETLAGAK